MIDPLVPTGESDLAKPIRADALSVSSVRWHGDEFCAGWLAERGGDVAKTITVFDDDTDFLDLMRDTLAESGYRVVAEPTADAALAIVLRERPALVILDFWMAGQGAGLTVLRLLREHPETAALPVLICSADHTALDDYADDWHALGCETLAKPFDLNDMLARVARLAGEQ
jgi:DNA-binding response OmpR family regulator